MSGIVHHTDGNLNDIRAYPFADTASRRADNGEVLPEYILNDCNIWWPERFGDKCFLASATLSPFLLTLSFSTVTPNGSITPIGVASISRLKSYSSAKINPLVPGTGGWILAGHLPENFKETKTWHFSDYKNSLLLARLAQSYPDYPVLSLGKKDTQSVLFDTVTFLAGPNLQITSEDRVIEGVKRRCIVFALRNDLLPELYKLFAGPCGKRPESKTCDLTPIQKIAGVEPDQDGVLYIDIDNANGIIDGEIIDPGEGTKGIALLTPVDYMDICAEPEFKILPSDLCESSSSSTLPLSQGFSSSIIPFQLSSSLSIENRFYNFLDPDQLGDWSFFERNNIHAINWEATPNAWGLDTSPKYYFSNFVMPFEVIGGPLSSTTRHLFWNAERFRLRKQGDKISVALDFSLFGEDFEKLKVDDKRIVHLTLADTKPLGSSGSRFFEAKVEIRRADSVTLRVATELRLFNGSSYITLDSGHVDLFTLSCSSSSLATQKTCNDFTFNILFEDELITEDTTGSGHDIHHMKLFLNNSQHYSTTVDLSDPSYNDNNYEYRNIQFVVLKFTTQGSDSDPQGEVNCVVNYVNISSNYFIAQGCPEPNVDNDTSERIPYKLFYEPNAGWSNDFGTRRALNQWALLPTPDDFILQFLTKSNDNLVYEKQYIEKRSGGHSYGILNCENSSINQYIYSAAFKAVSGIPKVGILLGWQNTLDNVFWAVVIDLINKKIAYGIHRLPHNFQPNLWVDIPNTDIDWPYDWHRLIVRMTFNNDTNDYDLSAWIDSLSTSSSIGGQNKVIPIDFNNPLYSLTGLTPWDGSTYSASMFADGSPGFYVYGGSARIAEYTVSPVNQDIIVPNKVSWLLV